MASRSSRLIDVYVGRRARERRLELGLSCEVVAKMVSLSPEAVRDFEVGSLRLEPAELADVAAALQIPVRYFYCETKQDESSQGVDARRLQAFGPQLIPPAARIGQLSQEAVARRACTRRGSMPRPGRPGPGVQFPGPTFQRPKWVTGGAFCLGVTIGLLLSVPCWYGLFRLAEWLAKRL